MQSPAMEVVKAGVEAIPAQEITVSQMGADYLSEYVYIKDVTLGTYNASGSTPVTDATGSTKLFKGLRHQRDASLHRPAASGRR